MPQHPVATVDNNSGIATSSVAAAAASLARQQQHLLQQQLSQDLSTGTSATTTSNTTTPRSSRGSIHLYNNNTSNSGTNCSGGGGKGAGVGFGGQNGGTNAYNMVPIISVTPHSPGTKFSGILGEFLVRRRISGYVHKTSTKMRVFLRIVVLLWIPFVGGNKATGNCHSIDAPLPVRRMYLDNCQLTDGEASCGGRFVVSTTTQGRKLLSGHGTELQRLLLLPVHRPWFTKVEQDGIQGFIIRIRSINYRSTATTCGRSIRDIINLPLLLVMLSG